MSTPKQAGDGRFYINIGSTVPGSRSQPKFMLGRGEAAAITRAALIEQFWDHCLDIAREMDEQPVWDEVGHAIAKEIAAGETTIYVKIDAGDSPDAAVVAHELCHLKEHNHSNAFYRLLTALLPDWERRRERLNQCVAE